MVREPLPGRFHRRVHRSDPRLVLHVLHVLATALFDRPAFKNVISHGIVLGSDGQKMSKSLRNYPDRLRGPRPRRLRRDALVPDVLPILRGGNLIVTEQGIREGVRQVMLPLWNVHHLFALYANARQQRRRLQRKAQVRLAARDGPFPSSARPANSSSRSPQRWTLRHLERLANPLRQYADALTNWYVRSRERFFNEDTDAFDTPTPHW